MKILLSSIIVFFTLLSFSPLDSKIVIIVNSSNPVGNLSAGEAKLYYLRKVKKRWPEINKNIKPVDRKSKCTEQEVFYSKVLGMSAESVEAYFSQKQYENAEKPQDKFASDAAIIDFVSEEPGAIAYVNASSLTGDAKSKVKVVLTID
jgi:ABC-type phosphate transport system substrate-binding protein